MALKDQWKDHYLGAHILYEFAETAGDIIVDIRLIASSVAVATTHWARHFFFHHSKLVVVSVPMTLVSATAVAVVKKRRNRRKAQQIPAFSGDSKNRASLLAEAGDCRECQARYLTDEQLNASNDD